MIQFSRGPLSVVQENFHLIEQHWNEVAKDSRKLNPAWNIFKEMDRLGHLACFIARDGEEVVGYTVFTLQPDLHAADVHMAYNDAVFLKKELRVNGQGARFLQYCEDELKNMGITMILWHVKPAVDYSRTLLRKGYRLFSTIYAKDI